MQWSLLFYTLENYESELGDPELGPALVQLALATVAQQEVKSIPCDLVFRTGSIFHYLELLCDPGQQTPVHNPPYWTGETGGGWYCQREGT